MARKNCESPNKQRVKKGYDQTEFQSSGSTEFYCGLVRTSGFGRVGLREEDGDGRG